MFEASQAVNQFLQLPTGINVGVHRKLAEVPHPELMLIVGTIDSA